MTVYHASLPIAIVWQINPVNVFLDVQPMLDLLMFQALADKVNISTMDSLRIGNTTLILTTDFVS